MLKISYIEKEIELIQYWKDNKIFEKSVEQRPEENPYIFYDGPPFATGLPHYGHILSFVTKDVFPRYWTMKGHRCERRWGWDCHGLPIESICEKALNLKQKNEIYEMGIADFNEFCRSKVLWYTNEWKKTVERMGKWIEFDNSYKTMDNTYMETVWYIFKKIYTDGYVYRGKKILFYCPRCETPLSNFEISMDNSYKDISEQSITAKFKLIEESMTFFLAWTTTPWTLIGNVALAVNSEGEYVKIKLDDEFLILIKNRLDIIKKDYEIVDEFKGKDLINKEYEPLYHISPSTPKKGHFVIDGGDEVLSDEGTGIIHMAIYGEFDYEMIKKHDLLIIQHIDEHGNLAQGPRDWIGLWFKDVDEKVLEDLQQRNLLFSSEDFTHSYPFCYRCDTPLIYNALDAWFIDIQQIKAKLLKTNERINWYPKEIYRRYESIVKSAPDWCISRNRFWATAMPIWECEDCKQIKVIGSIKELQENAVEEVSDDLDLHRHIVDKIHLKCSNCSKVMTRVPEVFDCWLESGSMPYAAKHYPFENVEWFKNNFPSDFVSEYVPQVRAWFYYMHVISVLLFDEIPFKNIVVNGNILAEDGTKMSKSKRNFPDPNLIIEKYGADALRIYLLSSQLMRAQDLNFKEEIVKQVYRRFNLLLSNVLKFYSLIDIDNVTMDITHSDNILDKWIVSLLNNLIQDITQLMDNYDTAEVSRSFFNFIEDLSTWYIKNSRNRFKSEDVNEKISAMNTLSYILYNLSKLLAPLTPFISEMIYHKLAENGVVNLISVHLEFWPKFDEKLIYSKVLKNMEITREVVKRSLELRDNAKTPVRQVLNEVKLKGVNLENEFLDIIAEAINVKKVTIEIREESELLIELDTKITPTLRLEGIARNLIRHLNNYRKQLNLSTKNRINLYLKIFDKDISEALERHEEKIKKMIQADTIIQNLEGKQDIKKLKIENKVVEVYIEVKN
ncbi:MAG: isoleucine--tRNA ligase [Candidatus Lokiarchaeota archaeon]|nr:isoleucine--tRNA ligase [Candidatus Lokiarchaeota archaeon]